MPAVICPCCTGIRLLAKAHTGQQAAGRMLTRIHHVTGLLFTGGSLVTSTIAAPEAIAQPASTPLAQTASIPLAQTAAGQSAAQVPGQQLAPQERQYQPSRPERPTSARRGPPKLPGSAAAGQLWPQLTLLLWPKLHCMQSLVPDPRA